MQRGSDLPGTGTQAGGETGWEGILDADETILWQGQPTPGMHWGKSEITGALFGLVFSGFALIWMIITSFSGGFIWMFGLIHFSVGIGVIAGTTIWPAKRRKSTWYTLTDKRAFIGAISFFGKKTLSSHLITASTQLETEHGALGAVYFATEQYRTSKGHHRTRKVGFERLENVQNVARLFRDVQEHQA